MGLELWWEEGKLRFRDPASGQFLLTPEESAADRLAERAARKAAETRAAEDRAERLAAQSRVAELEAELRRLRGE